ncbi:PepSY domain-containing protein [Luteimonas sp. BDR2-5]|uniref:PepSY domain-containing protein n=1 Tax=Proluteimonas luteida TaxID=2878685 RepID=UPI001E406A26|nr:PepSY domain-containing protein [Luteimonas sp. BDR2-5]MCD9028254.1 PepSY domain-containing protein [Luteimonas sp. BDR2-5]
MKPAFWARRAHKWIGLVVGVQALLWMVSGVYMTVISLDIIHGDHLAHAHREPLARQAPYLEQDALLARYPGTRGVALKRLLGRDVFELRTAEGTLLADAHSGERLTPLPEADAIALARALYQGEAGVARTEWVTVAPKEVATRPVPMWAVHFDDRGATTLYLSPDTGELLARRHSLWRWFDFLWMLHIMDYDTRSDVNNTLFRVASIAGLLFALSGVWLLFYSFRRRTPA